MCSEFLNDVSVDSPTHRVGKRNSTNKEDQSGSDGDEGNSYKYPQLKNNNNNNQLKNRGEFTNDVRFHLFLFRLISCIGKK